MCDCYYQTCEEEGCEIELPVHIGDYRHARDTVHVRCLNHPPPLTNGEAVGWEAFVGIERLPFSEEEYIPLMFVRCDELAKPSDDDVSPNVGNAMATTPVRDQYLDDIEAV